MTITYEDIESFKEWQTSEEYYNQESADSTPTVMDMVKEFAKTMGQEPNEILSESLIDEEYEEWSYEANLKSGVVSKLYSESYDPVKELKELSDLVYVIYGYASVRGWGLDEAVRRVHCNNIGRCVQPDGSIQRREDGKILKNKDYPKVQLEDLV